MFRKCSRAMCITTDKDRSVTEYNPMKETILEENWVTFLSKLMQKSVA